MAEPNPFFEPSPLPYRLPPFAEIRDEHYLPAFDRGFQEQLDEVSAIVRQRDIPTFDDLVALERSGRLLDRVATVFFTRSSSDSDDFTEALEELLAPRLAEHADAIRLNGQLYRRITALYDQLDRLELDAESKYLIERYYLEFTQAGAGLGEEDKPTLSELNKRLASLSTRFEKNLLADSNDLGVVVEDVAELAGLGEAEISAASLAATERGLTGKYLITLVLPTGHPYLDRLENRQLRKRIMTASRSRGRRGRS